MGKKVEATTFKLGTKEYTPGSKIGDWEVSKIILELGAGQHGEPMRHVTFKKGNTEKTIIVEHYDETENSVTAKLNRPFGGKRRRTHKRKTHKRKTHKRRN